MRAALPPSGYSPSLAGGTGLEQSILTASKMASYEVNVVPGLQVNLIAPSDYHTSGEKQARLRRPSANQGSAHLAAGPTSAALLVQAQRFVCGWAPKCMIALDYCHSSSLKQRVYLQIKSRSTHHQRQPSP